MQRFFSPSPISIDMKITDPNMLHQLTRVLRSKVGDHVVLFDGDGTETEYEIIEISKMSLSLRGKGQRSPATEPKRKISLYQALPNKYEKIEYILQKGVEVGIEKFIFFRSEYSQKLIISPNKKERFSLIAQEAVEQCGGLKVPEITFLEEVPFDMVGQKDLVLDTIGQSLRISDPRIASIEHIWVGPEGGWSEGERSKMRYYGFIFARFGERVLRTETAGVVAAFSFINQ